MNRLILALAVVALLAGCGAVVTPVDHECPGNPGWGIGSGCS